MTEVVSEKPPVASAATALTRPTRSDGCSASALGIAGAATRGVGAAVGDGVVGGVGVAVGACVGACVGALVHVGTPSIIVSGHGVGAIVGGVGLGVGEREPRAQDTRGNAASVILPGAHGAHATMPA